MLKRVKVYCPICNERYSRNLYYTDVESFIVHMMREHNWATGKSMLYYESQTEENDVSVKR